MKLRLLFVFLTSTLLFCAQAQTRFISGNVIAEEDNSPLPGVSVLIKGASVGTLTDAQGKFNIQIRSANDTLAFEQLSPSYARTDYA